MIIRLKEKETKIEHPVLFSELEAGDIFRYWIDGTYRYCLKILGFDADGEELNCVDLEDGDSYSLDPSDTVEKYDDSLELNEDSFIEERRGF